jgi:hypothetical protein
MTALALPGIAPPITRSASLSECGRYRWTLMRRWGDGGRVCWVMLNPSTADAEADDRTVREVVRFSRLWGYGSAVVVNLYPFRSSSPAECRQWADWERQGPAWDVRDVICHNAEVVIDREIRKAVLVVAAWGSAPWAQDWADYVLQDCILSGELPRPNAVHCLGTNADGSPKHPLARGRHRVPRDQRPILYRPEDP